jgi:hypothetical protein
MNYTGTFRDSQHFVQNTTPGMKNTWLIWSFVLLLACVGNAQTTPVQVKPTRATPTETADVKASPVATNDTPKQAGKVLQVQPVLTPTKGLPEAAFKELKANEVTLGRHTYSGIVVQVIKAKNPLQLLNPAAPAEYGSGWDNLDLCTVSGSGTLKLFSFSF